MEIKGNNTRPRVTPFLGMALCLVAAYALDVLWRITLEALAQSFITVPLPYLLLGIAIPLTFAGCILTLNWYVTQGNGITKKEALAFVAIGLFLPIVFGVVRLIPGGWLRILLSNPYFWGAPALWRGVLADVDLFRLACAFTALVGLRSLVPSIIPQRLKAFTSPSRFGRRRRPGV